MKKSIVAKVCINILFVFCSLWFLINCISLLKNGSDVPGILSNVDYVDSEKHLDNLRTYSYKLDELISFQEAYCKDGKVNLSKELTEGYSIKYIFDTIPFELVKEAYEYGTYNSEGDAIGSESDEVDLETDYYVINNNKIADSDLEIIHAFYERYDQYQVLLSELNNENTNFKYYLQWTDSNNQEHIYNNVSSSDIEYFDKYFIKWTKVIPSNADTIPTSEGNIVGINPDSYILYDIKNALLNNKAYTFKKYSIKIAVDTDFPINDLFKQGELQYEEGQKWAGTYFKSFIASIVGMLILLSIMIIGAGNKKGYDGVYLNSFDKWYTEVGFLVTIAALLIPLGLLSMNDSNNSTVFVEGLSALGVNKIARHDIISMIWSVILLGIAIEAAVFGFLSLIRRIKVGTVISNTLIMTVYRGIRNIIYPKGDKIKLSIYTLIGFIVYLVVNFILFLFTVPNYNIGTFLLLECVLQMITLATVLKFFEGYGEIYNGAKEISKGKLDYKIREDIPGAINKELAETVNNIGDGLENAIESSLKNERMKTDLITNVSHDIKTPLTSIVNYVDLLKRENIDNERVKEYIKVLENKADRLKTLTEDLVEASKLSSGVVKLTITNINLVELVNQVNGEFEEKFTAQNLTLVCSMPDVPVTIEGDGRRIWRILENIYNNAYKYSMPGTRVYVDVTLDNGKAAISVKNVSENPLNFDASELTERFIRGDVSRSTEGSGLGLSIVKSLVDLHNAKIDIQLDGDLFKIIIEFVEKRFT